MALFGIDNDVGKPAVEAAVQKLGPLLSDVENRLSMILNTALTRLNGTKITITIEIPPENPPPD